MLSLALIAGCGAEADSSDDTPSTSEETSDDTPDLDDGTFRYGETADLDGILVTVGEPIRSDEPPPGYFGSDEPPFFIVDFGIVNDTGAPFDPTQVQIQGWSEGDLVRTVTQLSDPGAMDEVEPGASWAPPVSFVNVDEADDLRVVVSHPDVPVDVTFTW